MWRGDGKMSIEGRWRGSGDVVGSQRIRWDKGSWEEEGVILLEEV